MAKINLLPWREERRAQRKKEFFTMLGLTAVAGIAAVVLGTWFMSKQIERQQARNTYLNEQIASLDKAIAEIEKLDKKKQNLLDRKKVIEDLQSNRSVMVHLLDQMVRSLPEGVYLTAMKQTTEQITLEGRAQSDARVSDFMRKIESSPWMKDAELQVVERKPETDAKKVQDKSMVKSFALRIVLENADADKTKPADGSAPEDGNPAVEVAPTAPASLSPSVPSAATPTSTPVSAAEATGGKQ
jgi:type IV pilus assembly protein PilN